MLLQNGWNKLPFKSTNTKSQHNSGLKTFIHQVNHKNMQRLENKVAIITGAAMAMGQETEQSNRDV
jgi:hypothetical protein